MTKLNQNASINDILLRREYYGGYEETQNNRLVPEKYEDIYLSGPGGLIGFYRTSDNPLNDDKLYWVATDYLGSLNEIANEDGTIVQERSYDTWGRPRDGKTWAYIDVDPSSISNIIDRGYTGHEHLWEARVINMNGRIYDPIVGQMMQPDNYVQDATRVVNFNRFGYCLNNPLKYTDPSGEVYFWDDLIVGGAGFAIGYVGYGLKTGNWGGKAFAAGGIGAGMALLAYYTGGGSLVAGTAAQGANFAAGYTASSVVNSFMPSIPIYQSANINVSVSPMIGLGSSGLTLGGSLNASGQSGDFVWSTSVSAGYNSGMSSLGEAAGGSPYFGGGAFAGYNDGHSNYGLGMSSTKFGGNTNQRVGAVTVQVGDLGLRLDEDYFPGISDGGDRYRTGGLLATYKMNDDLTFALGGSMLTGAMKNNATLPGYPAPGMYDDCDENMFNLRAGTMYGGVIYKGQAFFGGHNSERRLHGIQNWIHRGGLAPIGPTSTEYFYDRQLRSRAYGYFGSYNPYYLFY